MTLFAETDFAPAANCPSCSHAVAIHIQGGRCTYPGCSCPQPLERDAAKSAAARDEGMARAVSAQSVTDDWKERAMLSIRTVAERQEYVASVDVVELLTRLGDPPPPGSRVMGPLMRRAATRGYIEGPVQTRVSDRVTHHRGLENVWRSKLWKGST